MSSRPQLIIYSSHPIQYQVPWFRALQKTGAVDLRVVFSHLPTPQQQGQGFGVAFQWDTDLLDGYAWSVARQRTMLRAKGGFFEQIVADPYAELRDHRAQVVLLTGWHIFPMVQWLNAARRLGIPIIMRGESNLLRPRRPVSKYWHNYILRKCDMFLTIGTANRRFYEQYDIVSERMLDAPYFVDNDYFANSALQAQVNKTELRKSWSIPEEAVCFCFAGKLEHKKRIFTLLHALAQAMNSSQSVLHLLVVGSGEQLDAARQLVAELDLPVTFAGFLNQGEISSAYVASDCLVLPSDPGETWGLVVNEAMACSRPVIVSDHVGCQADLVEDGVTGFVFPLDETDLLARTLNRAADADLVQMGRVAYTRVTALCTVEKATAATLAAVDRLLQPARS